MHRVMIVEDDTAAAKLMAAILSSKEIESTVVRDGAEALARLEANGDHLPDLLVLDLNLPGTTGQQIINRLREISFPIPIVVVSAFDADSLTPELRQSVKAFVRKPYSVPDFVYLINSLLPRKKRRWMTDKSVRLFIKWLIGVTVAAIISATAATCGLVDKTNQTKAAKP